jgi:chromosome segregation ATPase
MTVRSGLNDNTDTTSQNVELSDKKVSVTILPNGKIAPLNSNISFNPFSYPQSFVHSKLLAGDRNMYTENSLLEYNNEEAREFINYWKYDWNRESDIQIENEPIKLEWESGCPFGFSENNYKGFAYRFCPRTSNYSYITTNGVAKAKESGYSVARSLKMPKGYSMKLSGAFISSYFDTLIHNGNVRSYINGSNAVKCERTGDVSNIIEFNYWVCGMNIKETDYIKVTKSVTKLLKSLLVLQQQHHGNNDDNEKIKECQTKKQTTIIEKNNEETNNAQLVEKKKSIQVKINEYSEKISTYEKILQGEINLDEWKKIIKIYQTEIEKLKKENEEYILQINKINAEIIDYESKETESTEEVEKYKKSISTIRTQIIETQNNKSEQENKLYEYESEIKTHQKIIAGYKEESDNDKNQIEIYLKSINELNLKIKEIKVRQQKRDEANQKILDIILSIQEKIKNIEKIIGDFDNKIKSFQTKITKIEETIKTTTTTGTNFSSEILRLKNQRTFIQGKINLNNIEIEKFQGYGNTKTDHLTEELKEFYKSEIEILKIKIKKLREELEAISKEINESNTKIKSYEKIITEQTNCIETNKNLIQKNSHSFSQSNIEVSEIIQEIVSVYHDSGKFLKQIKEYAEKAENKVEFLRYAKPKLHSFLNEQLADPKLISDIESMLRRRRRLRSMRRRRLI